MIVVVTLVFLVDFLKHHLDIKHVACGSSVRQTSSFNKMLFTILGEEWFLQCGCSERL